MAVMIEKYELKITMTDGSTFAVRGKLRTHDVISFDPSYSRDGIVVTPMRLRMDATVDEGEYVSKSGADS